METRQAEWVGMVMDRLQQAEERALQAQWTCVKQREELEDLRAQLERRTIETGVRHRGVYFRVAVSLPHKDYVEDLVRAFVTYDKDCTLTAAATTFDGQVPDMSWNTQPLSDEEDLRHMDYLVIEGIVSGWRATPDGVRHTLVEAWGEHLLPENPGVDDLEQARQIWFDDRRLQETAYPDVYSALLTTDVQAYSASWTRVPMVCDVCDEEDDTQLRVRLMAAAADEDIDINNVSGEDRMLGLLKNITGADSWVVGGGLDIDPLLGDGEAEQFLPGNGHVPFDDIDL